MELTKLSAYVYDTIFSKEEILYLFVGKQIVSCDVYIEDIDLIVSYYQENIFDLRRYNYYTRIYPNAYWRYNAKEGYLEIFVYYNAESEEK